MIERFIKSPLNLKRWRRFKNKRLAYFSLFFIVILSMVSFTAEFWAISKPIILKYDKSYYFPILKEYHPKLFHIDDTLYMNYRTLKLDNERGDFAFWPPVQWDPYESNLKIETYPGEPTKSNWLGTDDRGRDILTRLLYGYRYSITYSILVWFTCFLLGTVLGGVMGYFGSTVDFIGQRVVEVLSTVPQFFLLIIIISIFEPSLMLLVIISSLFGWISISYYVRGEFLRNRNKEFVEAARSVGASHFRIIFNHILPNSLAPIITFTPFFIAGNIVGLASLDYLGFGLTPPTPSWGELLNQAQKYFTIGWWLAIFPSVALFATLTTLTLIGEGVRDAYDPNQN